MIEIRKQVGFSTCIALVFLFAHQFIHMAQFADTLMKGLTAELGDIVEAGEAQKDQGVFIMGLSLEQVLKDFFEGKGGAATPSTAVGSVAGSCTPSDQDIPSFPGTPTSSSVDLPDVGEPPQRLDKSLQEAAERGRFDLRGSPLATIGLHR